MNPTFPRLAIVVLTLLTAGSCSSRSFEPGRAVLLYNGPGTSPNDVKAFEALLKQKGLSYSTFDARQLNELTEAQLLRSQLLIIPGGNYLKIGRGLSAESMAKVRSAVEHGLNYLGVCAGALLAGDNNEHCLKLTAGCKFPFYEDVNRNVHKNAVAITTAEGETVDHYWEDGPQLDGWGQVVSKYPNGTAATVQGSFGNGAVILCGFHPEAPESWRGGLPFTSPVSSCSAYAAALIDAALDRRELPHY